MEDRIIDIIDRDGFYHYGSKEWELGTERYIELKDLASHAMIVSMDTITNGHTCNDSYFYTRRGNPYSVQLVTLGNNTFFQKG